MPAGGKDEKSTLLTRLRVAATIHRNQSDLLQWYLTHYNDFAAVVATVRRPGWSAIATELNREGMTKPDGTPVTGDYAKHAWFRARRLRSSTAKETGSDALPSPSPETEEPTQLTFSQASASKPAPTVTSDDDDEIALTPFTIRSRKPGES